MTSGLGCEEEARSVHPLRTNSILNSVGLDTAPRENRSPFRGRGWVDNRLSSDFIQFARRNRDVLEGTSSARNGSLSPILNMGRSRRTTDR
ncbi:hypothetical protein Nepgr_009301 [Nepenthes gracilis]|uniref:Uncharacterized protein n=1 Tax=Nepenthes gracilis TaxID=150966 RepID=A0AAD3SB34_NEPGR|nr:hypothetical protein Nepgr_009301 [Nepenthes gracilis]